MRISDWSLDVCSSDLKALDAAQIRFRDEIAAARGNVLAVEGVTLRMAIGGEKTFDQFVEEADLSVIEEAYRHAARAFSPDVTRTYAEHVGRARHERSEEHTSELQSLMRISYAVFCLKKKK